MRLSGWKERVRVDVDGEDPFTVVMRRLSLEDRGEVEQFHKEATEQFESSPTDNDVAKSLHPQMIEFLEKMVISIEDVEFEPAEGAALLKPKTLAEFREVLDQYDSQSAPLREWQLFWGLSNRQFIPGVAKNFSCSRPAFTTGSADASTTSQAG